MSETAAPVADATGWPDDLDAPLPFSFCLAVSLQHTRKKSSGMRLLIARDLLRGAGGDHLAAHVAALGVPCRSASRRI